MPLSKSTIDFFHAPATLANNNDTLDLFDSPLTPTEEIPDSDLIEHTFFSSSEDYSVFVSELVLAQTTSMEEEEEMEGEKEESSMDHYLAFNVQDYPMHHLDLPEYNPDDPLWVHIGTFLDQLRLPNSQITDPFLNVLVEYHQSLFSYFTLLLTSQPSSYRQDLSPISSSSDDDDDVVVDESYEWWPIDDPISSAPQGWIPFNQPLVEMVRDLIEASSSE
ncbi:hypothetical protein BGZ47_006472, partial [Haplosporangium gracile]